MKLRKLLSSIAASTTLSACCLRDGWWEEQRYTMPAQAEGKLGELIAACRASDDCEPLCRYHWTMLSDDNPEGDSEVRDCERDRDTLSYEGYATCVAGRRPARRAADGAPGHAAGYLAAQAVLEAASVRAFADLFADLVAHDAPHALRRAAIAAAADEVRHAELCARLARRYGAITRLAHAPAAPRRSLCELAIDNAAEGCVRETFGALVAMYQASHAADPVVRGAMHRLAADEVRHAQLAWQVHRWSWDQLDDSERRAVVEHAIRARAELAPPAPRQLTRTLGLPDAAAHDALLAALDTGLWRSSLYRHAALDCATSSANQCASARSTNATRFGFVRA